MDWLKESEICSTKDSYSSIIDLSSSNTVRDTSCNISRPLAYARLSSSPLAKPAFNELIASSKLPTMLSPLPILLRKPVNELVKPVLTSCSNAFITSVVAVNEIGTSAVFTICPEISDSLFLKSLLISTNFSIACTRSYSNVIANSVCAAASAAASPQAPLAITALSPDLSSDPI